MFPQKHKTIIIGTLIARLHYLIVLVGFCLLALATILGNRGVQNAYAATSSTLNFQGRLYTASGATVPDGYYNVQFKLYDGGTDGGPGGTGEANAGTNLWTESYYDTNGVTAGNDYRLRVVNGYFSANLGSQTAFPGTINWDQELWLTMNIGGSTQTASPSYDGEMLQPGNKRTKLTGVPYAFRAGAVTDAAGNAYTADDLVQKSPGSVQSVNSANSLIRLNQTGAGGLLQLQAGGTDAFTINNSGNVVAAGTGTFQGASLTVGTTSQSGSLVLNDGSANTVTLSLATQGQSSVITIPDPGAGTDIICLQGLNNCAGTGDIHQDGNSFGADVTIGTNDAYGLNFETDSHTVATFSTTGQATFKNYSDSTTAFQVQNAAGAQVFNIGTSSSNLIANPSIEVNATGWVAHGAATVTRSTSQAYIGNASLQISTTAAANDGARYPVSLSSSTTYALVLWVRHAAGSLSTLEIGRSEDGSTDISCSTGNSSSTTGWVRITCTFTTGTVSGSPYIYIKQTDATSRTIYVDAVQLLPSSAVTPYREGTLQLNGVITSPTVFQNSEDSNIGFQIQNAAGTSNLFIADTRNNRVGIGTTGPNALLHVSGAGSGVSLFKVTDTTATARDVFDIADGGAATFRNQTDSTTAFQIQNAAGSNYFVVDTTNGKVGIGQAPSSGGQLLQINGAATATGYQLTSGNVEFTSAGNGSNGITKGAIADNAITANQVVVITGSNGSNQIKADLTTTARDTRVFGVAANSVSSGQQVNVKILGYATVDVDTSAVAVGDQLVTSTTSGRATVDNNATTGIVGYALSTKAGGSNGTVTITVRPISGQYSPVFRNASDSTTAFRVQNASGADDIFTVDTSNRRVVINESGTTATTGLTVYTADGSDGISVIPGTGLAGESAYIDFNAGRATVGYDGAAGDAVLIGESGKGLRLVVDGTVDALDISTTGQALFKNGSDSTTAFQIQDAAGTSNTFVVDTTNNRIGIGIAPTAGQRLEVDGNILLNSNTARYLMFAGADGGGLQTSRDNMTFQVDTDNNGSSDLYNFYGNSDPDAVLNINNSGAATFRNTSDSATGFRVQNAAGTTTLLNADTTNLELTVDGNTVITGSLALQAGSDFSTTGTSNNVDFGSVSLVRLTGASTQTITGIDNGTDGEILTIVNASGQTATISNESASSDPENRIITGTGSDLPLIDDSSIALVYDATSQRWRVTGSAAVAGGAATTLQTAYSNDVDGGDTIIELSNSDDSIIIRNPSSNGTDSAYLFNLENLSTGASGGLNIESAGTGNLLRVRDTTATAQDVLTIADGGATTFRNQTNSTSAFQIQNAAGTSNTFVVDTTNNRVGIGTAPSTTLDIRATDTSTSGFLSMAYLQSTVNPGGASSTDFITSWNRAYTANSAVNYSGSITGLYQEATHAGTGTIAGVYGSQNNVKLTNSGTITNAYALTANLQIQGAGTVNQYQGLTISNPNISGGGTLNNNYGIYVVDQTAGSSDYGLYIEGADTNAIYVDTGDSYFGDSVTVQTTTNSTTAFQIQDTTGTSNLLIADTTNNRIGIGAAPGGTYGTLQISSTGMNDGLAIYNGGTREFGFSHQLGFQVKTTGTNAWTNLGTDSGSVDILDLYNSSNVSVASVSGTGAALFKNSTNSTAAFDIQNTAGDSIFIADTTNKRIVIGELGIPTGQLYVGGSIPSAALDTITTGDGSGGRGPDQIQIVGNYLYIVNYDDDLLEVYDITDPTNITKIDDVGVGGSPESLVIKGHYAFTADSATDTVTAVDISDPGAMTVVDDVTVGDFPTYVAAYGNYLYVLNKNSDNISVVDVSNPESLNTVNTVGAGDQPNKAKVVGDVLYVINYVDGTLQSFDLSDPWTAATMDTSAALSTGDGLLGLAISGRYAYVTDDDQNMGIFDISNPANITEVGTPVFADADVEDLVAQGRYLYGISNQGVTSKLITYDISNPTVPADLGSVTTGSDPYHLAVQGRYAYVSAYGSDRLESYDIGGAYIQQLEAGGIKVGTLDAFEGIIANNLSIGGLLNVSGAAAFDSDLSIEGDLLVRSQSNSDAAFTVQNAAGSIVFNVDTSDANYASAFLGGPGYNYSELTFNQGATNQWGIGTDDTGLGGSNGFYISDQANGAYVFGLDSNGSAVFRNRVDQTDGFQIQDQSGTQTIFNVDTDNSRIGINTSAPSFELSFGEGGNSTIGVQSRTSNAAGRGLTVQAGAAGSGGSAFAGGTLTLQGGAAAGTGNANGGAVTIAGGAGVGTGTQGLVNLSTTAFTSASEQSFSSSTSITAGNVDLYSSLPVKATTNTGLVLTVPDPNQNTVIGRLLYVAARSGSLDFTLRLNSSRVPIDITMKANSTATLIWNGTDWTAAGASSSTDLQAAYNNTIASAGGAELVLNAPGGNADGLTIRNNGTTPIVGGLLEVQTSVGSNLFGVNNNSTEYANNGGAESSTFTMWPTAPNGGTTATITRTTTADTFATGQAAVQVVTTGTATNNQGVANTLSSALTANLTYNVSFTVKGTSNFSTLDVMYSRDGTNTSLVTCATGQTVTQSIWSRINCSFTAPATAPTSSNAIFIRQSDSSSSARTFYVDNLSVSVNANTSFAADGSVDNAGAFSTNWTNYAASGTSTVTQETSVIYDTSGSAKAVVSATAGIGLRNNLAITPQINTQYLVTFYMRSTTTMSGTVRVGFLPAGGTGAPSGTAACTDYNTQTVTANTWTEITCLFTTTGTTISNADLVVYQSDAASRTMYVDGLSITLNTNNSNNVQIGGGNKGGPVTLFTLDRSNGAPIAANNDAYLGSMYYDTSTGRIQCYEADGWGACGAAPDNIVNLNPEYAGAVLNGSGVGTMTADFCSNDAALSVNSTLCSSGQAKNYYRWTSPQATSQTYSIYVTYQLPATFNGFSSDDTVQLVGRVDSTSNAAVTYEMYKSTGSAVTQCGSGETDVITGGGGSANTWYSYGINGNESTGCSFNSSSAGNFIIFKINLKAKSNANAYVSTLSFVTTGR